LAARDAKVNANGGKPIPAADRIAGAGAEGNFGPAVIGAPPAA